MSKSNLLNGLTEVEEDDKNIMFEKHYSVTIAKVEFTYWKRVGPDKIQGFRLKLFTAMKEGLTPPSTEYSELGYNQWWLVEEKTILVKKYPRKDTKVFTCRPIPCLNLIWNLLA